MIHILLIKTVRFFGINWDTSVYHEMYMEKTQTDLEIIQLLSCTHLMVTPNWSPSKIVESKPDGNNAFAIKLEAIRIPEDMFEKKKANLRAWGWK